MKFLCRNCKAKYQIADEKVAGRTLRMTCQQCGEPIVVRGPARQTTGQVRPAAAPLQAPAPAYAPQASAKNTGLAADLARHAPPPPPEPAVPQEEWHVAINDAPVGPLRRDEVARRIQQGIIDRESLAWREGMDDWMQIKHIGELASLFAASAPAAGAPAHPAPAPMNTQQVRAASPSARADMAPIGGRKVVPVEPYESAYERSEPSEPPAEVAVATVGPVVSQDSQSTSRQPGWAQMFALVSGGAFILAAGALLGVRVLAPNNAAPPPAPAVAPVTAAPEPPAAAAPSEQPADDEEDPGGSVIELDMQAIDGKTGSGRRSSGSSSSSNDSSGSDKKKNQLTAEQKAMLERMGGGLDQGGPSNLRAPAATAHKTGSQGGQLTEEQLKSVVLNGRKNLQRCYETALRGSNSTDTVRLDVEIQVSPYGNVKTVRTTGKGLPGMDECITRTVKMWRFPKSGEETKTRFPVVFQPGT